MQTNEGERRRRWHLGRWGWLALTLAIVALLLTSALHLTGVDRVPVQDSPRAGTVERVVGAAREAVRGNRERQAQPATESGIAGSIGGKLHWIATALAVIAALLAVASGVSGGLVWELVFGIAAISAGALALQAMVGAAIALVVVTGLIGMLGQIGALFDGSSCCGG